MPLKPPSRSHLPSIPAPPKSHGQPSLLQASGGSLVETTAMRTYSSWQKGEWMVEQMPKL